MFWSVFVKINPVGKQQGFEDILSQTLFFLMISETVSFSLYFRRKSIFDFRCSGKLLFC
jgi:hypothetical protein